MKKLLIITVVAILYVGTIANGSYAVGEAVAVSQDSEQLLAEAYKTQRSDFQVQGTASIVKLLADDNNGSRHQRFLVRLNSGQTLLIAHNTSLAARIDDLKEGDSVEFYGEYEWNNKGGVIHWTHRDPKGHHVSGWIKHSGRIYQ
ncbi:MAG: DUF3465 domain-containing protein [Methylococcaceae bacterium]|nr:DUF3465 domain-containing protein [Methylococcaceae bacterium]MDZ4155337.1 DUF3465 domain-containing protein [Methylococcales bacterium]MDP2393949.1 DUF3465 domain-containing protein [Methylococcaceae bacterium]MDP3018063.1 DUF3465 domain-containing protein [Methylococcaceae bacterium]MDP3391826.1 DUF3465 domain-containing protein [Methylococcaceae bacterium]